MDQLERVLLYSLEAYQEAYLVLDALDESLEDNETRMTMLRRMERLAEKAPNVKILATSSDFRDVRGLMEALRAGTMSVDTSVVDEDIRQHVAAQLSSDRRLSRLNAETTLLVEETISFRSDGMYGNEDTTQDLLDDAADLSCRSRWAYCQVQEMKRLKSTKAKYVQDALHTLPATLEETHERILCGIEERYRPESLMLLRWLAYSQYPLTLRELANISIIDPTDGAGGVDIFDRGDVEDARSRR